MHRHAAPVGIALTALLTLAGCGSPAGQASEAQSPSSSSSTQPSSEPAAAGTAPAGKTEHLEQIDSGTSEDTDGQLISVEGSVTLAYQAEDTPGTEGAGLDVHDHSSEVDLTISNPGDTISYVPPFGVTGYFYYPAETGVCEKVMQYRGALHTTLDAHEMAESAARGLYLTDTYCLIATLQLGSDGAGDNALPPNSSYPLTRKTWLPDSGMNLIPYVPDEEAEELVATLNNPLGVVLTTLSYHANPAACEGLPTDIINHPDADATSFPPAAGENTLTATGPICQ